MDNQQNKISPAQERRKFLVKSSKTVAAGALFTMLPAKSVWATGIGNSLTASGHGSDINNGMALNVRKADYFVTNNFPELSSEFRFIFGIDPIGTGIAADATLGDVLTTDVGPNNINQSMAVIYLNATNHGMGGIEYPVLKVNSTRAPFIDGMDLANHLAQQATMFPTQTASTLSSIIDNPNQVV